jgi:CheY-like chemotaxis protein
MVGRVSMRSRLRGRCILVGVADEPLREALTRTLEREGATVTSCATSASVLDAIAPQTPDLCLLDVDLRDPGHGDVAAVIKEIAPRLPIVLVSAHLFEADVHRHGDYPILPLPFRKPQLLAVLGSQLPPA